MLVRLCRRLCEHAFVLRVHAQCDRHILTKFTHDPFLNTQGFDDAKFYMHTLHGDPNSDGERKTKRGRKRPKATPEEKAELMRQRNREHARSTRRRKKMYGQTKYSLTQAYAYAFRDTSPSHKASGIHPPTPLPAKPLGMWIV